MSPALDETRAFLGGARLRTCLRRDRREFSISRSNPSSAAGGLTPWSRGRASSRASFGTRSSVAMY